MNPEDVSVFIVDDDDAVRDGVSRLLRAVGFRVQSFASAGEFLARPAFDGVGCLLLDVQMPGLSGSALHEQLMREGDSLPIIFLTGHGDVSTGIKAMKQGAVDFLLKPVDDEVLIQTIQLAAERYSVDRVRGQQVDEIRLRMDALSAREREVMLHVVRGRLNKQIAFDLGISEKTVKVHRGRVMEKMKVRSVAALVHLCEMVGLSDLGGR